MPGILDQGIQVQAGEGPSQPPSKQSGHWQAHPGTLGLASEPPQLLFQTWAWPWQEHKHQRQGAVGSGPSSDPFLAE